MGDFLMSSDPEKGGKNMNKNLTRKLTESAVLIALGTVLSLLRDKLPEGLIEKRPESQLLIHLGQIENVKTVFEKVDVTDLHVLNEGLEVEGSLK